jgi:hypothetical protein
MPFIPVELYYSDNLLIKFVSYRLREINDFDLILILKKSNNGMVKA